MNRGEDYWEAVMQGAEYMALAAIRRGETSIARLFILDANEARDMVLTGAEIEAVWA